MSNLAEQFVEKIKYNVQISTKSAKLRRNEQKRKSWITIGIIKSTNRKCEKIFKKPYRWKFKKYKDYHCQFGKLIKMSKTLFHQYKIIQNKKILDTRVINIIKIENGDKTTEKLKVVNECCHYFTQVYRYQTHR